MAAVTIDRMSGLIFYRVQSHQRNMKVKLEREVGMRGKGLWAGDGGRGGDKKPTGKIAGI